MPGVTIEGLQKWYGGSQVIRDLHLTIPDGAFVALVGPSGCGKSTTLRMIAGLEMPSGGRIYIGSEDVTARPPAKRGVAMVFQSYALYPHMTVRDNLEFGLRVAGAKLADRVRRVTAAAEMLHLSDLMERRPSQLSGGQRQRVAIGRALYANRASSCLTSHCPTSMRSCVPPCALRSSACIRPCAPP